MDYPMREQGVISYKNVATQIHKTHQTSKQNKFEYKSIFFSLKYKGPSKHKCAFYTFFFFFHISNITFIYRGKVPLAVGHISHGFWTILWTSITTWHRASVAALPHQSLTPCCPQHNSTGHVHSLSKSASSKLMTVKAAERALNGFCWFYHIIKCIYSGIFQVGISGVKQTHQLFELNAKV